MRSIEVDLIAKDEQERAEWLNAIGVDSPFHEQFGYYADPVDESAAVLPKGWNGFGRGSRGSWLAERGAGEVRGPAR